MIKLHFMLFALSLFVALSCSDATEGVDSNYTITDVDNASRSVKGLAADGVSQVRLLIDADRANPALHLDVTADVEWGTLDYDCVIESVDGKDCYVVTITSDEGMPEGSDEGSVAQINYTIVATLADSTTPSIEVSIEVVRSVVVFVHGFASGPETFDPMLGYLRAKGLFIDAALYAADYTAKSLSQFYINNRVVPEAIDIAFDNMLKAGYVAAKATVIGHSMGGTLTRIYMQDGVFAEDNVTISEPYRDDILKVITIDTPHSGSQVADFGLAIGECYPDSALAIFSRMGAVVDLAVESAATADLNDSDKLKAANDLEIPTHVITAHMGTLSDVAALVKDEQYVVALLSYLLNAVEEKLIYDGDTSDIIVPTLSQKGGVVSPLTKQYITTYSNEWHCSVHTTEEVADDVMELLDAESSDSKLFTTSGFDPEELTFDSALKSSNDAIYIEQIYALPDEGDVDTYINIYMDGDGEIVAACYDSVTMGDTSSAVTMLYIARLSEDTESDQPHIVFVESAI